jgi:hypothetical protein
MLFEPRAAAQLFAAVLVPNLKLTRKPVAQPGHPVPWSPSELEGRIGSTIMPEWMDAADDPKQSEWQGDTLLGHYEIDDEGVAAQPVMIVEKGVLKGFLLTRTPVKKGLEASNGSARLPGSYGASAAGLGNLFIHASTTAPLPGAAEAVRDSGARSRFSEFRQPRRTGADVYRYAAFRRGDSAGAPAHSGLSCLP